jgi:hypothetical protein
MTKKEVMKEETEQVTDEMLINDDGLYELWYEWDDSGTKFKVRELSDKDKEFLLSTSKKKVKSWRGQTEETDAKEFIRLMLLKTIVDWEDVTNEKLLDILSVDDFEKKDGWDFVGDKKKGTEFKFNPENLRILSVHRSIEFIDFFNHTTKHIKDLKKEKASKKLKN